MSANLIFDAGEPEILRNGRFRFTKAGGVEKATGFGDRLKWEAATQVEAKNAYNALVKEAQSNPSALTEKARTWLTAHVGDEKFLGVFGDTASDKAAKEAAEKLSGALKFAEAQQATFELEALKKGILQYGDLGEKVLTPETIAAAESAGFKLADMAVLRKDAETLKGLLKVTDGKQLDYKAIEALFIKHHASGAMLAEAVGNPQAIDHLEANGKPALADMAVNAAGKVSSVEGEIRNGIGSLNSAADTVKSLEEAKATEAEIKAAKEALAKEKDALAKLVAKPEGQQAMKLLHADEGFAAEYELAQKHSSEFKTAAGKAATEVKAAATAATDAGKGAKLIGGGKWYSFIHSAESAGTAVEKVGKFRWGKAAAIGIPTAAVLAFVASNKGPGERAASVSQGRENEPAMAR